MSIYKIIIAKKTDFYNFICDGQVKFFKENFNYTNKIVNIPACLFIKEQPYLTGENKFTIGIPGNIQSHRRDYIGFLDSLSKLSSLNLRKIRLLLIGRGFDSYYASVIEKINKLKEAGLEFEEYEGGYISNNEYLNMANKCHVFISPLVKYTIFENTIEIYGKSKSSGSFYDLIRYKKPIFFPSYIEIPFEIKDATYSYESYDDLNEIIIDIVNQKVDINNLYVNCEKVCNNFQVETKASILSKNLF